MQHMLHMPSSLTAAGVGGSNSHRNMVVVRSNPSPPAACVLLPGVDRKQLAEKSQKLEADAAAAHKAAQELNKQGRYEEAKVKYAEMKALDAEALTVTRQLGCQQCMPDPATAAEAAAAAASSSTHDLDPAHMTLYEQYHTPTAWPTADNSQQQGDLTTSERARGSIIACLTCDAAATGVQWIYDLDTLADLQQQRQQAAGPEMPVGLEFYDLVQSPFLGGYSSGRNSPYGEQGLLLLQSLAEQQGLDIGAYAGLYYDSYSNGFEGYMNASTVGFLRSYGRGMRPPATGVDDAQADAVTRLPPLVALYAGDPRLMDLTAAVTRVTQNTAAAVAWACAAAAVLERLVMGQGAAAAVEGTVQELRQASGGRMPIDQQAALDVADGLERVLQLQHTPHAAAVDALGRNCHLPNSCQTPLHAVLYYEREWQQLQQQHLQGAPRQQESQQHQDGRAGQGKAGLVGEAAQHGSQGRGLQDTKQQVLVAAVRDALAAGGCCASRAGFVGACMGALLGPEAVPAEWAQKHEAHGSVLRWADAVCGSRNALHAL